MESAGQTEKFPLPEKPPATRGFYWLFAAISLFAGIVVARIIFGAPPSCESGVCCPGEYLNWAAAMLLHVPAIIGYLLAFVFAVISERKNERFRLVGAIAGAVGIWAAGFAFLFWVFVLISGR